jgi:antitoxin Phd
MEDQYTIAEAKNRLPSIIHSVERGPSVMLTRRGRPVAVLLSIAEYERLNRKMGGFWPALQAVRNHIETERIEMSEADFDDLRDKTPGREVGWTQ